MRIFAICVVKNEADIIRHSLAEASEWADRIFVYDNGSDDGTWEIVRSLALTNHKVVPWRRQAKPFYEGLRGEVFNAFRHLARPGDWWCFRLDADEFYDEDPRQFLAAVPVHCHFVATDTFEFVLTQEDAAELVFTGCPETDLPQLKYYLPTTWSEARFFRHRDRLGWPAGADMPARVGILCPARIRVRHYQYRSPHQIAVRVRTRRRARAEGFKGWDHAAEPDWRHYLKPRADLYREEEPGQLCSAGSRNENGHRFHDYWLKRLLHGLGIWP